MSIYIINYVNNKKKNLWERLKFVRQKREKAWAFLEKITIDFSQGKDRQKSIDRREKRNLRESNHRIPDVMRGPD